MTKQYKNPKVLALNVELELQSEGSNCQIRIEDPSMYQVCTYSLWWVWVGGRVWVL